jgi:hypothetical protein
VRVQDLSDAARTGTGPFAVAGDGQHTVEFRSVDQAGNVEPKQSVQFRIGTPPQPSPPGGGTTPPGTTPPAAEPPAQPGLARFSLRDVRRSLTTRRLTRRGLTMRIDCTDRMQGVARLRVSRAWAKRLDLGRRRTLASRRVRCAASGLTRVTLKPSRSVARKLRRYDRTHRRAVRAVLEVRLKAPFERTRRVTRRVTIR